MALLSEPDFVWRKVLYGNLARVKTSTGAIVAEVVQHTNGTASYGRTTYIDLESAKRACEAKYPSGENFT
jgi:hypothetical protein